MATAKQSVRGRKQDRAKVAAGQEHELGYESQESGRSKKNVVRAKASVTVADALNELSRAHEGE